MSNEVLGTYKTVRDFYLDAALHYYPKGFWDDDDIRTLVEYNILTEKDFKLVTGKEYTPRDKGDSSSSDGSTGSNTNSSGSDSAGVNSNGSNTSSSNASAGDKSK